MKLRYRISIFLLAMTTAVCGISGTAGYRIAKDTLVDNMSQMSIKLMKEIGTNLDARIASYSDNVYTLLSTAAVREIMAGSGTRSEAELRSDFSSELVMRDPLFRYTKRAFLLNADGNIFSYYASDEKARYSNDDIREIFGKLEKKREGSRRTVWTSVEEQPYMVRWIEADGEKVGAAVFALKESFFDYGGNVQEILTENDFVTLSSSGQILQNHGDISGELCALLTGHHDGQFYVYSTVLTADENERLGIVLKTPASGWFVVGLIPYSRMLRGINNLRHLVLYLMLFLMAADLAVTSLALRSFTKNLKILEDGMLEYEKGNFHHILRPAAYDELGMMALQFNHMGYTIGRLENDLIAREKENKEAEIQTLQAAINPHFLYNTLGSIKYACLRKGENESAELMDAMIQLLRFTLHSVGKEVTFAEEIAYIRNYVKIEEMRFDHGFSVEYQIEPGTENLKIPGFILQPMVENSIIHGFDMSRENNRITIQSWRDADFFYICEADNGIGMSDEQVETILNSGDTIRPKREGLNSIGISIVDKRLRNEYGPEYYMTIDSAQGKGTEITLCIPAGKEAENE